MKKRILSILLAAIMVFSLLPVTALAETDQVDTYGIEVTYNQTNARFLLQSVNDFRTDYDPWYWNENNTTQIHITELNPIYYDYALEQTAMQRAAEIALNYSHTKPDGTTTYSESAPSEIIAITDSSSIDGAMSIWLGADKQFDGQADRRVLLSHNWKSIAMACVKYGEKYYWVQEFSSSSPSSSSPVAAVDTAKTVNVDINSKYITSTESVSLSETSLNLNSGDSVDVPTCTVQMKLYCSANPGTTHSLSAYPTFTSADTGVVKIENGKVVAVGAGTTTLSATVLGQNKTVNVSVAGAPVSDRPAMNMGSGAIAVKDNIYYGDQKQFRVLSTNGNTTQNGQTTETATYYVDGSENPITPSEGPLFVISENNFGIRAFDTNNKSVWANSSSKTWCNGDFYTEAGITGTEQNAILTTSKADDAYADRYWRNGRKV